MAFRDRRTVYYESTPNCFFNRCVIHLRCAVKDWHRPSGGSGSNYAAHVRALSARSRVCSTTRAAEPGIPQVILRESGVHARKGWRPPSGESGPWSRYSPRVDRGACAWKSTSRRSGSPCDANPLRSRDGQLSGPVANGSNQLITRPIRGGRQPAGEAAGAGASAPPVAGAAQVSPKRILGHSGAKKTVPTKIKARTQ